MNDSEQLGNLAYGAWSLAGGVDGPHFVREAIEQAYKLGQAAAAKEERNKTVVMLRKRSAVILANAGGMGRRDTDAAAAECQRLANWLADPPDINAALRAIPQPAAKEGE